MTRAASVAVVLASLASKSSATAALSVPAAAVPLRTMLVLIPPGCTQLTFTGRLAMIISWRSDSVNPRTANFAAL